MKQTITFGIIFLLAFQLMQGQKIDTPTDQKPLQSHEVYIQKHKTNKTVAWVLLGSGVTMTVVGWDNYQEGFLTNDNNGERLSITGFLMSLASIPFFRAAKKNKKKARWAEQKAKIIVGSSTFENQRYMAISYTIEF